MSHGGDTTMALVGAVVLVMLSGLFSGLNLGLMSFTGDDLGLVISGSSDKQEVAHAKAIRPVRARGNLLLCTLLLGNTLVNAVIAILLSDLTSGIVGAIVTTALILVFGEIIPQSVCSRYALLVGAAVLPIVQFFIFICYPIAYPISLLLDWLLGREISGVFSRQGLLALIKLNVESEAHAAESGLTKADMRVLAGALTYQDHVVADVMTNLADVFSLSIEAELDKDTILSILSRGNTRIPVYDGAPSSIVALLFCKDLLGIGFERSLSLRSVVASFNAHKRVRYVGKQTKLNDALAQCQHDRVHMLIVAGDGSGDPTSAAAAGGGGSRGGGSTSVVACGIVTMEDFLEEILQEHIVDETDFFVPLHGFGDEEVEELVNPAKGSAARTGNGAEQEEMVAPLAKRKSPPAAAVRIALARGKTGLARVQDRKGAQSPVALQRLNSRVYDTTALLKSLGTQQQQQQQQQQRQQAEEERAPGAASFGSGKWFSKASSPSKEIL